MWKRYVYNNSEFGNTGKNVYQTVFQCTGCPTKMETSRVLMVTEVAPFNPAQQEPVDEAQKTLVQF